MARSGARVEKLAYSVEELAEALSVGRTLVYELVRNDEIPSFKLHGRRLFRVEDAQAFVDRLAADAAEPR